MKQWSVAVGFGGYPVAAPTVDEQIAVLADELAEMAPAISVGKKSMTVRLAVEANDAVEAAASVVPDVVIALDRIGLGAVPVNELEITEWTRFEEKLAEPTYPELVGITEIAELLGISRQRASELARSSRFPAPHADLAAGPVWLKPNVMRFVEEWDRKPGRPPSSKTARRLQQIIDDRRAREAEAARDR